MTSYAHFIGIDPGPTPGIVHLWPNRGGRNVQVDVIQCTHEVAPALLWSLLNEYRTNLGQAPAIVQIERFVIGRGSMRSGTNGAVTRDLIGALEKVTRDQPNVDVVQRNAAAVKPWATDRRLMEAGLYGPTKGMQHARDAARHALFCAVMDGGLPDPLSKRSHA